MELPEKQGLKQVFAILLACSIVKVAVELPEKQGLKQSYYYNYAIPCF